MSYKVNFTRLMDGKRLQTSVSFRKRSKAEAYKNAMNKNLKGARARVVKLLKRKK